MFRAPHVKEHFAFSWLFRLLLYCTYAFYNIVGYFEILQNDQYVIFGEQYDEACVPIENDVRNCISGVPQGSR